MRAMAFAAAMALPSGAWAQEAPTLPEDYSTFPSMPISNDDTDHEWPFSIPRGELTCIDLAGQYYVFFSEPWGEEKIEIGNMTIPRNVAVTTNPFALMVNIEDKELLAPFDSLEQLIRRMGPFEAMGTKLCLDAEEKADEQ